MRLKLGFFLFFFLAVQQITKCKMLMCCFGGGITARGEE